uniref:Uncharacterized protein n=2 Tax=Peronospora matthiolae TaxID=2874970 RepID=A0AAV1V940_9STRA
MTHKESASQIRWYLEDYATSPSARTALVGSDTWGGCDMVGMAANFLQQSIYVIEFLTGQTHPWRCRKFVPTTITRHRRRVVTAAECPLGIMDLMDAVLAAKIEAPGLPPLVLRYQNCHYSAINHSGSSSLLPDLVAETTSLEQTAAGTSVCPVTQEATAPVPETSGQLAGILVLRDDFIDASTEVLSRHRPDDCNARALVERQVSCSTIPSAPPARMRPPPPTDRKRALVASQILQISDGTDRSQRAKEAVAKREGETQGLSSPQAMRQTSASTERTGQQRGSLWNRCGQTRNRFHFLSPAARR